MSNKGIFFCCIIKISKLKQISLLSWQCPNNVLLVYLKSWDSLPPEPHSYNRIKISLVLFRRLCWWKVIFPRLHLVFLFSSVPLNEEHISFFFPFIFISWRLINTCKSMANSCQCMRNTFQIINEGCILQLPWHQ